MTEPVAPPMSTDAQKAPATVTPAVSPENKHIDAAHLALAARNHTAASLEIEMASLQGPPSITPETIYLTGLLYADPENPAVDIAKAHKALQRIITEYPESGRRAEARILSEVLHWTQTTESENNRLRQEVVRLEKKLTEERNSVQQLKSLLEKMKKIDLDFTSEK